jgi:hypothetical protein
LAQPSASEIILLNPQQKTDRTPIRPVFYISPPATGAPPGHIASPDVFD